MTSKLLKVAALLLVAALGSFILGCEYGADRMKRWQDSYYAAHPKVQCVGDGAAKAFIQVEPNTWYLNIICLPNENMTACKGWERVQP
jgi:hypothetical protein